MANKAEALILKKTKQIADAAGTMTASLGDIRLNKSGSVGTEPIMNPGDPQVRTEVKLGKFGAFQIPTKKDAVNAVKKTVSTVKSNAGAFAADIKKNGISPMDDNGITGVKVNKKKKPLAL